MSLKDSLNRGWLIESHFDNGSDVLGQHGPVQFVGADGASDKESSRATNYRSDDLHPCQSFTMEREREYEKERIMHMFTSSRGVVMQLFIEYYIRLL